MSKHVLDMPKAKQYRAMAGMKQRRTLDFESLPSIEGMDIFIRLAPAIESGFVRHSFLTETYERAKSALMFFLQTKEDDERWRNDARLRAGLNEFYSLEDAARRDARASARPVQCPRIAASQSPLVHLMYVLRHVNVHTQPTETMVSRITVISELGGESREFDFGAVMLDRLTINDLQRSHEVQNYYRGEDIERALGWLLGAQQNFGIGEVFRAGLNVYCSEILASFASHTHGL